MPRWHAVLTSTPHTQRRSAYQQAMVGALLYIFYNIIETITDPALDPCKYTSGRWLRRDKLERDARFWSFDFDALRKKVLELCPGATSITNYEKKEGGYNRVFIFTCDNPRRFVARIPTSVAGPARLTTNSEVATIKYSRLEHLSREI